MDVYVIRNNKTIFNTNFTEEFIRGNDKADTLLNAANDLFLEANGLRKYKGLMLMPKDKIFVDGCGPYYAVIDKNEDIILESL